MTVRYTILILTHDRLELVQRCFDSLAITLARPDVACIVLDNGSTDGTAEWLQQQCGMDNTDIELILSPDNLGVAGGRSELLRHTNMTRERTVFLDSDVVIVDDSWLDILDNALEPENIGCVGPGGSFVLPDWSQFTACIPGLECDVIAGYCQMFKTKVLKAGVRLDLDFGIYWTEDSDFCMQIRAAGFDVWCIPTGIVHTPGLSGSAANDVQLQKNLTLFRDKWQGKGIARCENAY